MYWHLVAPLTIRRILQRLRYCQFIQRWCPRPGSYDGGHLHCDIDCRTAALDALALLWSLEVVISKRACRRWKQRQRLEVHADEASAADSARAVGCAAGAQHGTVFPLRLASRASGRLYG